MDITVVSREMILPSTPTPSHLRHFMQSLLDQHIPHFQIPTVFHYPSDRSRDIDQVLVSLRDSLAKTLSIYYPLAGRIRDYKSIYCNDEGALFVETRAKGNMSDFFKRSDVIDLSFELVAFLGDETGTPAENLVQVGVQVNVFSCGGISIGFCISHKIADAGTLNGFIKCWAALASGRDQDKSMFPDLISASSLFPPKEHLPLGMAELHNSFLKEEANLQRRFVFNGEAIAALKAKAASQLVPHPSRVLVVACFIWERIMNASENLKGFKTPSVLAVAKDIRPHTVPPLQEYATGNNFWLAMVPATHQTGMQGLVSLVRERVSEIDSQFVQKLQGEQGFNFRSKCIEKNYEFYRRENPDTILLSGINKFRFTELDFGWGKPVWISHIRGALDGKTTIFANTILMGETAFGDGIEAWLVFGEKEMTLLENDPKFLSFASRVIGVDSTPSPSLTRCDHS